MRTFVKPKVVVSKCLEFDACRWNGAMISSDVVRLLKPHVDFTPVCPEMEIGLGVPRKPIRILSVNGELSLMQHETEKDVTEDMVSFGDRFLGSVGAVDGFILKYRSPSCGLKDVMFYPSLGKSRSIGRGCGIFGGAVLERFPLLPIEDEGRLSNYRIREHFLTKLFAFADFREVKKIRKMKELVRFQTHNKFMLMAYNQKELRLMGRIVANPEKKPIETVLREYEQHLSSAFLKIPRYTSHINVLMHALGYFSDALSAKEKAFFLDSLEQYRNEKIPLSVPVNIAQSWIVRFENEYLSNETFFEPYPQDLVEITDSGKGRKLKG